MAASLISNVVGVPIAWYTMKTQPWIPTIAGLVTYIVAILSCFFLPETLERPEPSVLVNESTTEEEFEPVERPASLHQYSKKKNLVKILEKIEAYHFIFKSPELTALSITFLLQTLGSHVTTFTLQLASERFHWSLGDVSYFRFLSNPPGLLTYHHRNRQAFSPPSQQEPTSSSSLSFSRQSTMCSLTNSTSHP